MSEAGRKFDTPLPQVSRDGIKLPWGAVATMLLIIAGGIGTYVFVKRGEFDQHVADERERMTVIEQTEKHHEETIGELKEDVKDVKSSLGAVEPNIRTMLQEVGVPASRIAKPKK